MGVDTADKAKAKELSMRELIKAKRITKQIEDNDYQPVTDKSGAKFVPSAQAILYSYFSSLVTYPMYVHLDNANDAVEFVTLSIELGGFPLVDAVFEDNSII